jgi:glycosyltransferase involved in cell wall biosynthesis
MFPKLIYLVTEDWYFVSHRLPMARAARDAGFEVHVATRVATHGPAIEREGFVLHPLHWERGSLDPRHVISVVKQVRMLYSKIGPALAHHVALAPTIIGSLAATGLGFPYLNALAGLGFAFTSETVQARAIRKVLSGLLRFLLRRDGASVLVQNPDDRKAIEALGIHRAKIALIPGSGVDTGRLSPMSEPPLPIAAAFVGRLLYDKGLGTLIAAHELLRQRGIDIHLLIAGEPDPANPASIPEPVLAEWKTRDCLTFLGRVNDIRDVWAKAHIAVLPSRREGLPLTLLEAAACGRPLIATDVPGCREIARPGINGLLVPPDAPGPLADAIAQLAADESLRHRFGAASRRLVEAEFSSETVGVQIVTLYRRMLGNERYGVTQSGVSG